MKKLFTLLALFFAASSFGSDEIELRFHPEVGKTYTQTVSFNGKITIKDEKPSEDDDDIYKEEITEKNLSFQIETETEIKECNNDGNYLLNQQIKDLTFHMTNVDSKEDDCSFNLKENKTVCNFKDKEEDEVFADIVESILPTLQKMHESIISPMGLFVEENQDQEMEQMMKHFQLYPSSAVKVGDNWSHQLRVPYFPANTSISYQLRSIDKNSAFIDMEAQMNWEDRNEEDTNSMKIAYKGSMELDLISGNIKKNKGHFDINAYEEDLEDKEKSTINFSGDFILETANL